MVLDILRDDDEALRDDEREGVDGFVVEEEEMVGKLGPVLLLLLMHRREEDNDAAEPFRKSLGMLGSGARLAREPALL
jgi:hypothetical protein